MSQHILFGQCVSFSAAQDRYIQLMLLHGKASDVVEAEFQKWYHSCGSLNKVLDNCEVEADNLIGRYIDGVLYNQLLEVGIYDIGKNTHHVQCIDLADLHSMIGKLSSMLKSIDEKKNAEAEYRELRKQCRGKVSGGGFGLRGSLRGMFMAGTINAVTGAGHTVANTIGNIGSSISAASSKSALYQNNDTCELLTETILNCLADAFVAHADIIRKYKSDCIDNTFNFERSNALLENAMRIPEKAPDLLVESFRALPTSIPLLKFIFLKYHSERRNVLNAAKFYGIDFSSLVNEVLNDKYPADAKHDETKALAAKARILALMDEMGIQESETLNTLECDCLERLVADYVLEDRPSNAAILEKFRQYDAREHNKQAIIKKHLIWQLGAEYHVSFTPEESEKVIAQEYSAEAKANTPAAEAAKQRILFKMEAMGVSESATLDQLESDCVARLCTNYQAADEKTCDAMLDRIRAYDAQEKIKTLYLKKVQSRIEEIWSAEDGEIFDNLYLKTDIEDQTQKDAAIAYIKEKGRTSSSSQYLNAITACTPGNIKKARAYVSWNLCMAISAAILIIVGIILLAVFDVDVYLCAILTIVGIVLLGLRRELKSAWNTLTIRGNIFHPQIFKEHMPNGKTPVMPALQACIVILLAAASVLLIVQRNAKKNIAAETPTMAATVDATSSQQQNHANSTATLPAESNHQSVTSSPEYNETVSEDSVSDQASQIYKGNSYEDVLAEVAETFPAATYALFDMTADGNPELIVKTGTSQSSARYDIYSLEDDNTVYLGSLEGAYTELYPISSYCALLSIVDNGSQATLSLVVYQDGELTSIEAFSGNSAETDTSYVPLEFAPIRKFDASQWVGNPATINDWAFSQFLDQNWTYNMLDELGADQRYALNYRASMLAQFGISSLRSSRLDELLFFAAGYLAANDPTKLDISRKQDQLVYALSVGNANTVLSDFFGLQPDYNELDETHGVFLSTDTLFYTQSPELYDPYVAIVNSIEEESDNRMYYTVTFDLYHVVDQSLDWYDYEPFYTMTAEDAAQNASLMKIRTITERLYCISDSDDRFDTCWIKDFDITDS